MGAAIEKAAFSVEESCAYICTSRPTLYRLMDSGDIPSFHIGRRRLVLKEHLDRFLRQRLAAAGNDLE
jgi:excisionase family DNA binding protein